MELIIFSGLLMGIVEVCKQTFKFNKRYIPAFSFLVGFVLLGVYSFVTKTTPSWEVIQNIIICVLGANGLWSATKTSFKA